MGEETRRRFDTVVLGYDQAPKDEPARWDDCRDDIEVRDEWGVVHWVGPRYMRCARQECHSLVTHGMVAQGGCWCGNRRLLAAMRLTAVEKTRVQSGFYPLHAWEVEQIGTLALPEGKTLG